MVNKKVIGVLIIVALVALAGCSEFQEGGSSEGAEKLGNGTGAEVDIDGLGESYYYEVGVTEANQKGLVKSQPPFQMDSSLERQNLIERYKYLNDEQNTHHVYMLSHDGKVVNYEVAQGKVSSVNSKLTNDKQIIRAENCEFDGGNGAGGAEGSCFKTVESPQMDGSYGSNGDAIFFFTPDGHYVEWNGIYVVSEEPKQITTEKTLVEITNETG